MDMNFNKCILYIFKSSSEHSCWFSRLSMLELSYAGLIVQGLRSNLFGPACPFYCSSPGFGALLACFLLGLVCGGVFSTWYVFDGWTGRGWINQYTISSWISKGIHNIVIFALISAYWQKDLNHKSSKMPGSEIFILKLNLGFKISNPKARV